MTDKPQSLSDAVKAAGQPQTIADYFGVSCHRVAHHAFKDGLMTKREAWYLRGYENEPFSQEIWDDVHVWSQC